MALISAEPFFVEISSGERGENTFLIASQETGNVSGFCRHFSKICAICSREIGFHVLFHPLVL